MEVEVDAEARLPDDVLVLGVPPLEPGNGGSLDVPIALEVPMLGFLDADIVSLLYRILPATGVEVVVEERKRDKASLRAYFNNPQ